MNTNYLNVLCHWKGALVLFWSMLWYNWPVCRVENLLFWWGHWVYTDRLSCSQFFEQLVGWWCRFGQSVGCTISLMSHGFIWSPTCQSLGTHDVGRHMHEDKQLNFNCYSLWSDTWDVYYAVTVASRLQILIPRRELPSLFKFLIMWLCQCI